MTHGDIAGFSAESPGLRCYHRHLVTEQSQSLYSRSSSNVAHLRKSPPVFLFLIPQGRAGSRPEGLLYSSRLARGPSDRPVALEGLFSTHDLVYPVTRPPSAHFAIPGGIKQSSRVATTHSFENNTHSFVIDMPYERFEQASPYGVGPTDSRRSRTPSNNAPYVVYGNAVSQEPVMPQPTRPAGAYNSIIPGPPSAYSDAALAHAISPPARPFSNSSYGGASSAGTAAPHYYPPASPDLPPSPRNEASPFLADKRSSYGQSLTDLPQYNGSMYHLDNPSFEKLSSRGSGWASEKGSYVAQMPRLSHGRIQRKKSSGGWKKWWILSLVLLMLAAGAAVAAYFVVKNKNNNASASSASSASNNVATQQTTVAATPTTATSTSAQPSQSAAPTVAMWGTAGSTVTRDDGSTFVYNNQMGGSWCSVPFNDSAQAQGDVPALDEPWDFSRNGINGVNLGGWLTLEPFITPALYEPYVNTATPAVDEYTLSTNLGANLATTLTEHYATWITEDDIYQIAAAGLNWVRIGLPFWAIETIAGEPFLEGVAWTYFLKGIEWCRKYGIRITLDFHAVPGSQNGWNHSGKLGFVGFLHGPMGTVNSQRTLNYIRTLTEFICQPEYTNVIPMFSFLNEPFLTVIGQDYLEAFYYEVYNLVRGISGIGKGPYLSIHDGFENVDLWYGFMQGADRVALDSHPYISFGDSIGNTAAQDMNTACANWAPTYNTTMNQFGLAFAGEFSLAFNDCGEYLNGVGAGNRYEGTYPGFTQVYGSCNNFVNVANWTPTFKQQAMNFGMAQMDAMRNWFFWTWKIGNSTITNTVPNPLWSYQLGLQEGYMVPNPRTASGKCVALLQQNNGGAFPSVSFTAMQSWMTGGVGAGTIVDQNSAAYTRFPPAGLPALAYSATGASPITLPTPTYSGGSTAGSGWADTADVGKWYVPTLNGAYLSPYATAAPRRGAKRDEQAAIPIPAGKRGAFFASPTPAP